MKELSDSHGSDDDSRDSEPDSDEGVDTGEGYADFKLGDRVEAWWKGEWFFAEVVGKDRASKTLTLKFSGQPHSHPPSTKVCRMRHTSVGYKPRCVRKAVQKKSRKT